MENDLLIPEKNIVGYVDELCDRYGLDYVETTSDRFAKTITELSGDKVITDKIRGQLLALKRGNIISTAQMLTLLARYIVENKPG